MSLLNEDEAADVLTITRRELRELVRNRRVPIVAVPLDRGEAVRFDQQDLRRVVESWKRPSTN
jgi:excisionase family DNA binding protein